MAEVTQAKWRDCLVLLMTGKAPDIHTNNVPSEAEKDYATLKDTRLCAHSSYKEAFQWEFWQYRRKPADPLTDVIRDL